MPREQGGAGGDQAREGAAGEGERRDSGGLNDWQRIEAEQAKRDAIGRKWDATHDPSPEFENSAMPLGPDYGRDRPKHREYTPEQQAELEATYARPIQELLALRDQDPRAGHNRDEQGRILDADGNPREFIDPHEQPLKEQASFARTQHEQNQTPSDHRHEDDEPPARTTPDNAEPAAGDDNPTADESEDHSPAERSPALQAPSDEQGEADDGDAEDDHSSGEPTTEGDDAGDGNSGDDTRVTEAADVPPDPDQPPQPDQPAEPTPNETVASEGETTTADEDATGIELPRDLGELVGQLAKRPPRREAHPTTSRRPTRTVPRTPRTGRAKARNHHGDRP